MRRRAFTVAALLLCALALGGRVLWQRSPERPGSASSPVTASQILEAPSPPQVHAGTESVEAPVANDGAVHSPVDVATRERFNEQARAFFATAAEMDAEHRVHEARQLEQELARLEQAGGLSAGETLLIRAGLIRETVPAGAQQDSLLKALQQRYRAETQLRIAAAQVQPDPQFGSYKVREAEIVNEVMAMETIPDGLSRNEYLRQRLQSSREQLTP